MAIPTVAIIVIGACGSFCMLLAFALLNFNRNLGSFGLDETNWKYHALNAVGGALASSSAILTNEAGSYPLAVLEGAWCIIGVVGLVRIWRERWSAKVLLITPASYGSVQGHSCASVPA
eukprot:Opistho-2@80584